MLTGFRSRLLLLLLCAALPLLTATPTLGRTRKHVQRNVAVVPRPTKYTVTEIAIENLLTAGVDVNNAGQVAGAVFRPVEGYSPFIWKDGRLTEISIPNSLESYVMKMGEDGTASGRYYLKNGIGDRPFVWKDGQLTLLQPGTGEYPYGVAYGVSPQGVAVGSASTKVDDTDLGQACRWSGGAPQILGSLGGNSTYSHAHDINSTGTIVGYSYQGKLQQWWRAVRWVNGGIEDLGSLAGPTGESIAEAVNDAGQIAGRTQVSGSSQMHACIWNVNGVQTDLHPSGELSGANDLNSAGQVVGAAREHGQLHAYLWRDGKGFDLNSMISQDSGWFLSVAGGINDQGWIVGSGRYNGADRAFLLKPADESELAIFDANINYTSGIQFPLSGADAVPATWERLASEEWSAAETTKRRERAAADGVTLLLLRLKLGPGKSDPVTFKLESDFGDGTLGSLWRMDSAVLNDTTPLGGARNEQAEGAQELTVTPVEVGEAHYAFALYRTPRDFDPAGGNSENGSLRERGIKITHGEEGVEKLTLVRPLVIYQHGTFDKPAGWNNFPLYQRSANDQLAFTGGDKPFYAGRTSFYDAEYLSAGPMRRNAEHMLASLYEQLESWRNLTHTAGTQADVVTHSFGGPVTRRAAQLQAEGPLTPAAGAANFRAATNWGHGPIHKLITIAGTHRGSHMPNSLAYVNYKGLKAGVIRKSSELLKHPIDRGAVEDQFVLSPALRELKQTRIPGHAIVGSGLMEHSFLDGETPIEAAPFVANRLLDKSNGPFGSVRVEQTSDQEEPNWAAYRRVSNFTFNFHHDLPSDPSLNPDYDLTVSSLSMKGGMPRNAYSDVTDLEVRVGAASGSLAGRITHVRETTSEVVAAQVEFLLKQPSSSPYFAYFPAVGNPTALEQKFGEWARPEWLYQALDGSTTPRPGASVSRPIATERRPGHSESEWVSLPQGPSAPAALPNLSASDHDGVVAAGDSVLISVSWNGRRIRDGFVQWSGERLTDAGFRLLSSSRTGFVLNVPADSPPGLINLMGVVNATDRSQAIVSLVLEVVDPEPYDFLQVSPGHLTLRSVLPSMLSAYGVRSGGRRQDLTLSPQVLRVSEDPGVVRIKDGTMVEPTGIGSTIVVVGYPGLPSVEVPVTVEGSTVPVVAAPPSRKPMLRRTSKAPVKFAFLSTPTFDARTILPETVRVSGARPLKQARGALALATDVNRDRRPDLVVTVRPVDLDLIPGAAQIPMVATTSSGGILAGKAAATVR